jgi:Flp pilus assembly pilin Flp
VLKEQAGRGRKVTNSDTEKENPMMNIVKKLWNEENGQDLAEYALIMAVIALGATVAMTSLKTAVSSTFSNVASNLTAGS